MVKAGMHDFLYLALFGALAIPAVVPLIDVDLAQRAHVAVLAEPAAAGLLLPPAPLVRADQLSVAAAALQLHAVMDAIATFLEYRLRS